MNLTKTTPNWTHTQLPPNAVPDFAKRLRQFASRLVPGTVTLEVRCEASILASYAMEVRTTGQEFDTPPTGQKFLGEPIKKGETLYTDWRLRDDLSDQQRHECGVCAEAMALLLRIARGNEVVAVVEKGWPERLAKLADLLGAAVDGEITAEQCHKITGLTVKHIRRQHKAGKLPLTLAEALAIKQQKAADVDEDQQTVKAVEAVVTGKAMRECTSATCTWSGFQKLDDDDCPIEGCGAKTKLATGKRCADGARTVRLKTK
jgi:hypothetical protein